ncbi:MAG: GFA family protein [Deltaproteobacteria bacterium]|nr:GFA family protein [Deltaproteobacteria bacterium]
MATYTGSCACGSVRYEFAAEPVFSGHCQCRDCLTDSGHAPLMMIPQASFKVTGTPKFYERKADSGNTVRNAFCQECGSPLFGLSSGFPDAVLVMAGSLDDPGRFVPQMVIYTDSGHAWDYMNPSLPKFGKSPAGS